MTTVAHPRTPPTDLERQIVAALAELRTARAAVVRTGTARSVERMTRAEAALNLLLEYRFAIIGR
jgi:hypothetical protein